MGKRAQREKTFKNSSDNVERGKLQQNTSDDEIADREKSMRSFYGRQTIPMEGSITVG